MDSYTRPEAPLNYSYKSVNDGLADRYVFSHWWPIAIRAIPRNMSANAVSILGSLFCWLAFAILAGLVVGPIADFAPRHPWIFGLAALCVFLYQTLDALDGIQARRTGASGPMGEFVDHWFDSINAFMIPLGIALAFPTIPGEAAALTVLLCGMADWTNIRAVMNRGYMKFGPVSSEEVLTLTYLLLITVWCTGYGFWASPSPALGFPPIWIIFALAPLLLLLSVISNIAHSRGSLGWLCAAMGSLVPMAGWMIFHPHGLSTLDLLLGGLLLGGAGTRFAGDVLREHLSGLRYPVFYADFLAIDALLLLSILVPGLQGWVPLLAVSLSLAWTTFTLARQFFRMKNRILALTGVGLFGASAMAGAKAGAASRGGAKPLSSIKLDSDSPGI